MRRGRKFIAWCRRFQDPFGVFSFFFLPLPKIRPPPQILPNFLLIFLLPTKVVTAKGRGRVFCFGSHRLEFQSLLSYILVMRNLLKLSFIICNKCIYNLENGFWSLQILGKNCKQRTCPIIINTFIFLELVSADMFLSFWTLKLCLLFPSFSALPGCRESFICRVYEVVCLGRCLVGESGLTLLSVLHLHWLFRSVFRLPLTLDSLWGLMT